MGLDAPQTVLSRSFVSPVVFTQCSPLATVLTVNEWIIIIVLMTEFELDGPGWGKLMVVIMSF